MFVPGFRIIESISAKKFPVACSNEVYLEQPDCTLQSPGASSSDSLCKLAVARYRIPRLPQVPFPLKSHSPNSPVIYFWFFSRIGILGTLRTGSGIDSRNFLSSLALNKIWPNFLPFKTVLRPGIFALRIAEKLLTNITFL